MGAEIGGVPHASVVASQGQQSQHRGKSLTQSSSQKSALQRGTMQELQKAVKDTNTGLKESQSKIEFQYDEKANRVWLKVVDQSGKVLMNIPPKGIQETIDALNSKSLHTPYRA